MHILVFSVMSIYGMGYNTFYWWSQSKTEISYDLDFLKSTFLDIDCIVAFYVISTSVTNHQESIKDN